MWNTFSQVAGALIGEDESLPPSLEEKLKEKDQHIDILKQTIQELELMVEQKDKELEDQASQFEKVRQKNKARVAQLTNQIKSCNHQETKQVDWAGDHEDSPASKGKVLLLRKQLEECRHRLAAAQRRPPAAEISTQIDGPTENPQAGELHAQLMYKDSRILELINHITEQERTLLDLQESLKEKDEVLQARTKAVMLLKEDLGRRGQTAQSDLEATKLELREMQEKFSTLEQAWHNERSRLEAREAQLKAETERLDTARFNMAATNAELQRRLVLFQQENLEHQEEIKRLAAENQELSQKLWDLEGELPSHTADVQQKSDTLQQGENTSCSVASSDSSGKDPQESISQLLRLEDLENNLLETFSISSLEQLYSRLEQHSTIVEDLGRELREERASAENLQNCCSQLKLKLEELEKENLVLASQLGQAENRIEKQDNLMLQDELSTFTDSSESYQALTLKVEELTDQIALQERQLQDQMEINLALKAQVEEAAKQEEAASAQAHLVGQLQDDLLNLQSELSARRLEVESLASTLEDFSKNLTSPAQEFQVEDLLGKIEAVTQQRDNCSQQLEQALNALSGLRRQMHQQCQEVIQGLKVLISKVPVTNLTNLVQAALEKGPDDGEKFLSDYSTIISRLSSGLEGSTLRNEAGESSDSRHPEADRLQMLEEENKALKLSLQENSSARESLERMYQDLQSLELTNKTLEHNRDAQTEAFTTSIRDLYLRIRKFEAEMRVLLEKHSYPTTDSGSGGQSDVSDESLWQAIYTGSKVALDSMSEDFIRIESIFLKNLENLEMKDTLQKSKVAQCTSLESELLAAREQFQQQDALLEDLENMINQFMEVSNMTPLEGNSCKANLKLILEKFSDVKHLCDSESDKLNVYASEVENLYEYLSSNNFFSSIYDAILILAFSEDNFDTLSKIVKDRLEEQKFLATLTNNADHDNLPKQEMALVSQANNLLTALEDSFQEREAVMHKIRDCEQQNLELCNAMMRNPEECDGIKKNITQIRAAFEELAILHEANKALNKLVENLNQHNSVLCNNLLDQNNFLKEAKQLLMERVPLSRSCDDEKSRLLSLLEEREAALENMESNLSMKEMECNSMRLNMQSMEANCAMITEALGDSLRIEELWNQNAILASKITMLEKELQEKESLLQQDSEKIDKLKERIFRFQSENDSLQKEIGTLKEKLQEIPLPAEPSKDSSPEPSQEVSKTESTAVALAQPFNEDLSKKFETEHLIQSNKESGDQDIEQLRSQLTIAKVKMNKMLQKLKAFKDQNVKLQDDLESSVSLEKFRAQEAEELQKNLQEKEQTIVSLNQQIDHHHSHALYETAQLRKEITELKTLQEVLEEKILNYKQVLQEKEAKLLEANTATQAVVRDRAILEEKIVRLQAELAVQEDQCLGLRHQLLSVENREQQLQQRHLNAEELNKLLMTDNQNYQSVLQDLQAASQKLELELSTLRHLSKPQDASIHHLTQRNQRLEEENAKAKAELEELAKKLETQNQPQVPDHKELLTPPSPDLEVIRRELEARVEHLEQTNSDLSSRLHKACETWAQKEEIWNLEKAQLKTTEETLLQDLSRHQSQVQKLTSQVQQAQEELEHWHYLNLTDNSQQRTNEMQPDILASHGRENMPQPPPATAVSRGPEDDLPPAISNPSSISSSTSGECRILIDGDSTSPSKTPFFSINRLLQNPASRLLSGKRLQRNLRLWGVHPRMLLGLYMVVVHIYLIVCLL